MTLERSDLLISSLFSYSILYLKTPGNMVAERVGSNRQKRKTIRISLNYYRKYFGKVYPDLQDFGTYSAIVQVIQSLPDYRK